MIRKPLRVAIMLDLNWPYKRHAAIFAGTQQYAKEQGWYSIIDEFAHDTLANCDAQSIPYDGVIARANLPLFVQSQRAQIPVVNVWASSPVQTKLPSVHPDFYSIGEHCIEHLLARGFRNFAIFVPPKSKAQDQVTQAINRVTLELGLECMVVKVPQDPSRDVDHWRKTQETIARCVNLWQPPIGVYVFGEGIGRMVAQACHHRGLRVPQDVAIIAGQNEETLCEHPQPSLTSMEIGFERVGYEAAKLLHALMEGHSPPSRAITIPPVGLVVRESTDFYAVDDEQVSQALQYISTHSHRRIGPNEVAKAVNMETRTLQNRFGKLLNRPIATEIRRVRLERAKRELTDSKKSLADIARDVGFGECMRMYEVFRRELNLTPSQYRKQAQLKRDA